MDLDRYKDSYPAPCHLAVAIKQAELLLALLKAVQAGDKPSRSNLLRMATDETYCGPVVKFRLDDLFDGD